MKNNDNRDLQRVCLACGEIHNGKTCPLIAKKLNKYSKYKKKNFLMGNILLKCIEKDIDFLQILLEIAENNEEAYESSEWANTILPIEQVIEYFAVSLNCSSAEFYKNPEKTVMEYASLINDGYINNCYVNRDNSGRIDCIELTIELDQYSNVHIIPDNGMWTLRGYEFTLLKVREGDDWVYEFYLHIPIGIFQDYTSGYQKKMYPNTRRYYWGNMFESSANSFLLASGCNGIFEEIFEKELDSRWTEDELITDVSLDDSRYDIWINKLFNATKEGILQWNQNNDCEYHTYYDKTEILIHVNHDNNEVYGTRQKLEIDSVREMLSDKIGASKNEKEYISSELYVRNQEGRLGIRFRKKYEDKSVIEYDKRIISLINAIDLFIEKKERNDFLIDFESRTIEFSDVIMSTYSLICHNHFIIPLKGIVKLLTIDNEQIEYEIYVGYCAQCNLYYCFKDDYLEMIKHGTPLCVVYNEEKEKDIKHISTFNYKSQSILNAMGYTVGADADLSVNERQKILIKALHNKLIEINDLVSFLNWLIQTRKTQSKYSNAVNKWQEDLKFVKQYEIENRQITNVDGIVVKN